DDDLPAVARRHPTDRWLLRQVLRVQERDGGLRRSARVARRDRRHQLGDQHLLLPADRDVDVLQRGESAVRADAIGRARGRDGVVSAADPRARHHARLVAEADRRMTQLHALARAAGIDPEYQSWRGVPIASSDEALVRTLHALGPELGFTLDRADDASVALVARARAPWTA